MINESNEKFKANSLEEDTLLQYLKPCSEDDPEAIYGSASAIAKILSSYDDKMRIYSSSGVRENK